MRLYRLWFLPNSTVIGFMGVRVPPGAPSLGLYMKKTQCDKCGNLFANKGGCYNRHVKVCSGVYKPFVKLEECKHCKLSFDKLTTNERANHSRWCKLNPKRPDYVKRLKSHNPFSNMSAESLEKQSNGIKAAHARGCYDHVHLSFLGKTHSIESKEKMRQKALSSDHRRLVRSLRDYVKKDGTLIKLDSSWEEALATRLDELGVNWTRPKAIRWLDNTGVQRHYFPDFYLTDYDLYLDPKNPIAYNVQLEKINCLREQISNLVFLTSLDECKKFTPNDLTHK